MSTNSFMQLQKAVARLIETVPFFKGLKPADLFNFLSKATQTNYARGEIVFSEGDEGEQTIYLIMKGSFDVKKRLEDGSVDVVDTLEMGQCFGEMALVDNQPRSATVVAKADGLLLGFTGDFLGTFPDIAFRLYENLARIIAQRYLEIEKETRMLLLPVCEIECFNRILRDMPPPSGRIGPKGLSALSQLGQPYTVAAKEFVVKEKTLGQNMYIVLEGFLEVCKTVEGEPVRIAALERGNYFGETALVSDDFGRTASVLAVEDSKLVRLNAGHLQKAPEMGSLVYKELARIFSMRLRRSTKAYMQTYGKECHVGCPMRGVR